MTSSERPDSCLWNKLGTGRIWKLHFENKVSWWQDGLGRMLEQPCLRAEDRIPRWGPWEWKTLWRLRGVGFWMTLLKLHLSAINSLPSWGGNRPSCGSYALACFLGFNILHFWRDWDFRSGICWFVGSQWVMTFCFYSVEGTTEAC